MSDIKREEIEKVIDELEKRQETCGHNARNAATHAENQYHFGKKFAYMRAADILREMLAEADKAPESPDPGGLY